MPVSCHFRGCKAPLSKIVSELPLPFYLFLPVLLFVIRFGAGTRNELECVMCKGTRTESNDTCKYGYPILEFSALQYGHLLSLQSFELRLTKETRRLIWQVLGSDV